MLIPQELQLSQDQSGQGLTNIDSSFAKCLKKFLICTASLIFYENCDNAGNISNINMTTNMIIIGARSFVLASSPFLFACSYAFRTQY